MPIVHCSSDGEGCRLAARLLCGSTVGGNGLATALANGLTSVDCIVEGFTGAWHRENGHCSRKTTAEWLVVKCETYGVGSTPPKGAHMMLFSLYFNLDDKESYSSSKTFVLTSCRCIVSELDEKRRFIVVDGDEGVHPRGVHVVR